MVKPVPVMESLEVAIRAAATRQAVVANNIANIETPGYRRQDVQFQDILAKALEAGKGVNDVEAKLVTPMSTEVRANGNDVDLDMEIGELLKSSGQYKTYVRLLAKLYHRMDMAMSGQ